MGRYTNEVKSGGGFKPDIGIHNAICCQVVDLGTHNTEWEGKVTGKAPIINYTFEFVDIELEHDGEKYHPMWGIREKKSLGKKTNMKAFLEGWRGKQYTDEEKKNFDWGAPLGKSCCLVIGPNTKGNPKLTAIVASNTKLKGMRELHEFWVEAPPDFIFPEWMPDWMAKIIGESYEYSGMEDEHEEIPDPRETSDPIEDDDIPF